MLTPGPTVPLLPVLWLKLNPAAWVKFAVRSMLAVVLDAEVRLNLEVEL